MVTDTAKALQRLWKDSLTVTEYKKVPTPNGATGFEETVVLEGRPCKLSFVTLKSAGQADAAAPLAQIIKIFTDKDVEIKPGSKITVMRGEHAFDFIQSGLPGVFSYHQEIYLAPFRGWA